MLAVDDEMRIDLGREAMRERAAFVTAAIARYRGEE